MRPLPEGIARARMTATSVWRQAGAPAPANIDIEAIAGSAGFLVVRDGLVGAAARLTALSSGGVIRVAATEKMTGRCRFSIAHELGHAVLHADVALCSEADLTDAHSDAGREREANAFAAELLMPQAALLKFRGRQYFDADLVRAVADEFRVSLTAAALASLDTAFEPCAVVMCDRERVRWRRISEDFYLKIKGDVPPTSNVRKMGTGEAITAGQNMDVEDWCLPPTGRHDVELFEEVLPLSSIGAAIVLLTRQES